MEQILGWEDIVNPFKLVWLKKFGQGPKVLDLGAGALHYSIFGLEQGWEVTAVDQKLKRELLEDQGPALAKLKTLESTLEHPLPFSDQSFDMVMAWDVIEHVENEEQLLREIKRVLKVGGRLLLSVPHADDSRLALSYLTFAHFKDKTHFREYTLQGLRERLEGSHNDGLKVIEIDLVGGSSYPYALLCFIDNSVVRFVTRAYIWFLKKTKLLQLKNCHGDVFACCEK